MPAGLDQWGGCPPRTEVDTFADGHRHGPHAHRRVFVELQRLHLGQGFGQPLQLAYYGPTRQAGSELKPGRAQRRGSSITMLSVNIYGIGVNRDGISPKSHYGRVKPPPHRIERQTPHGQVAFCKVPHSLFNGDKARTELFEISAVGLGLLLVAEAGGDLLTVAALVGQPVSDIGNILCAPCRRARCRRRAIGGEHPRWSRPAGTGAPRRAAQHRCRRCARM